MSTNCASRTVIVGNSINLDIKVLDALGNPVDADTLPSVEIKDPNGTVMRALSPAGVGKIETGTYRFSYTPPTTSRTGIWTDHWRATVDGFVTDSDLQFVVLSATASIGTAGAEIGDAPCVSYTQAEIQGINILMAQLKCRLKNDGVAETLDEYGNKTFTNCPIFSDDELLCFLNNSLGEFNQTPHWTNLGFDNPVIYNRNVHVIVEGAYIIALAAQMLVEAGREYTLSDNAISILPPPLSTVMNNQFGALLTAHTERLKFIKISFKPVPIAVGSYRVTALNPAFLRLRHLRERQII